jgi:hypothetical protein
MGNNIYLLVFLMGSGTSGMLTRFAIRVNQDRFPNLTKYFNTWNEEEVQEELQCFFGNPTDVVHIERIDHILMNPGLCEE